VRIPAAASGRWALSVNLHAKDARSRVSQETVERPFAVVTETVRAR
jgi:hypothetical protein